MYASLRPLLFGLPAELAHSLVSVLLALPYASRLIPDPEDHPSLHVDLAGIRLRSPVGLAAGFDKSCRALETLGRLGFGYVVGGTVTRSPRRGNPKPRVARSPQIDALVNAMGLPNPGATAVAADLRRSRRTCPRFVSIADEGLHEVLAVHEVLEPLVDGFELNASCPNVSWGRDRDNEAHLVLLVRELHRRKSAPLFVKLPPYRDERGRNAVLTLARIAVDAGADGLTCSNSLPVLDRRLAPGAGALSGRPLFEWTTRIVNAVAEAVAGAVPINACGGIFEASDALACLRAGATTVQLYTSLVYEGPGLPARLNEQLASTIARTIEPQSTVA